MLSSGFLGLPPYAVVAALAGTMRVNIVVFELTGLLGRAARFLVVLLGVGLLDVDLPWH